MKTIATTFVVSACLYYFHASAQEGIPTYTAGTIVGYATNGAGFAFSPVVPIDVTALGFGGSDLANASYQVSLFDATGDQLATATITGSSTFYNQTYYQSVPAVYLIPGDTYYIGAMAPTEGNNWIGNVSGGMAGGSFSVNPDISYLSAATGFMSPATFPGTPLGPSYFFVDENFEFTVVPEPSALSLMGAAGLVGMIRRRRWPLPIDRSAGGK